MLLSFTGFRVRLSGDKGLIHNVCIKLFFFFFPPLDYQGEEIVIVLGMFGLVLKQVSTGKLWLNLNGFMGLFHSCGFQGLLEGMKVF